MNPLQIFIGYDPREHAAYEVADFSIRRRASEPVLITPLILSQLGHLLTRPIERRDGKLWCPISEAPMSTEFAISRFCVPFLQREGWALFADCDILCLSDIAELFALADPRYAVQVVKHDLPVNSPRRSWTSRPDNPMKGHLMVTDDNGNVCCLPDDGAAWHIIPGGIQVVEKGGYPELGSAQTEEIWKQVPEQVCDFRHGGAMPKYLSTRRTKMDGQPQLAYTRKNWSSVILWNCAHPAHARLTSEALNTWPGRDLHAFKWLEDSEIGELPQEWNWLVGVTQGDVRNAHLLHFTLGGPWFPEWIGGPCDELWIRERCGLKRRPA